MTRLLPWVLALILSLALAAVLLPWDLLYSDQTRQAITNHAWGDYREALTYLIGILAVMLVVGIAAAFVLIRARPEGRPYRVAHFLVQTLSLGGLSPLQAGLVFPLTSILVINLAWLDPSVWAARSIGFILFGVPLGADFALRFAEHAPDVDWRARVRSIGGVLQEQAPALAGRLVWIAVGVNLILLAISRQRRLPDEQMPGVVLPSEILVIAAVMVLIAFLLWFVGGWVRSGEVLPHDNTSPSEPVLEERSLQVGVWGLVALVLLLPVVMTWFAGDPLPRSFDDTLEPPGSPMLPFTTDWGSNALGQDLHALLVHSWRSAVGAGLIAGVLASAVGLAWRFGAAYLPRTVSSMIEATTFRIPPVLLFIAATGLILLLWEQYLNHTRLGVATALVLLPQALPLMRTQARALPAAVGSLVLLGILLVIAWTLAGLSFLGWMSPVESTFGNVLVDSNTWAEQAPWLINRALAFLLIVVAVTLAALGALVRAYNLPLRFTRLRG